MDTKYFEDYQKQFTEWQKQFFDWQKKFVDTWMENLPNGKTEPNVKESFDKAVNLQQEMVKTYLENQEKTTQMLLEAQKKFWDQYFEMMRKTSVTSGN